MPHLNHIERITIADNDRWSVTLHATHDDTYQVRTHEWAAESTNGVYELITEPTICRHYSRPGALVCFDRHVARLQHKYAPEAA